MVAQGGSRGAEQVHDRNIRATKRSGPNARDAVQRRIRTCHQPWARDEGIALAHHDGVRVVIVELINHRPHDRGRLDAQQTALTVVVQDLQSKVADEARGTGFSVSRRAESTVRADHAQGRDGWQRSRRATQCGGLVVKARSNGRSTKGHTRDTVTSSVEHVHCVTAGTETNGATTVGTNQDSGRRRCRTKPSGREIRKDRRVRGAIGHTFKEDRRFARRDRGHAAQRDLSSAVGVVVHLPAREAHISGADVGQLKPVSRIAGAAAGRMHFGDHDGTGGHRLREREREVRARVWRAAHRGVIDIHGDVVSGLRGEAKRGARLQEERVASDREEAGISAAHAQRVRALGVVGDGDVSHAHISGGAGALRQAGDRVGQGHSGRCHVWRVVVSDGDRCEGWRTHIIATRVAKGQRQGLGAFNGGVVHRGDGHINKGSPGKDRRRRAKCWRVVIAGRLAGARGDAVDHIHGKSGAARAGDTESASIGSRFSCIGIGGRDGHQRNGENRRRTGRTNFIDRSGCGERAILTNGA